MALNVYNFEKIPKFNKPIFLIGAFESFHLGHYELLKKAEELQKTKNYKDIVLVFFKDVENLNKYSSRNIFSDFEYRMVEFANLGFKNAVYLEFSKISHLSTENFINNLLENQSNYHVIVGEDFKYGFKAKGGAKTLVDHLGMENVSIVPLLKVGNNIKISTTFIKECAEVGDVELVNSLNMYKTGFSALINKSENNITLEVSDNLLLLKSGIYLAYVEINNFTYYAILQCNLDTSYELTFIDFQLNDCEKLKSRIKVIKLLRFFTNNKDEVINEKDLYRAKKWFTKK